MCYHKLYIFDGCGHIVWGRLTRKCSIAHAFEDGGVDLTLRLEPCTFKQRHSYQTYRFYSSCSTCGHEAAQRRTALEEDRQSTPSISSIKRRAHSRKSSFSGTVRQASTSDLHRSTVDKQLPPLPYPHKRHASFADFGKSASIEESEDVGSSAAAR
jgi:hypothetical protein